MDETAIQSKAHSQWLHARIAEVAQAIVGVDNSSLIPTGGYDTGFAGGDYRPSLVSPEELEQTCHHLIQNPYLQ